jgi:hypothetical protein
LRQHITIEQFQELKEEQVNKATSFWKKKPGSLMFCEIQLTERKEAKKYNGYYHGVITSVENDSYNSSWDLKGTTGSFKYIIMVEPFPLFSYGELVEIIQEQVSPFDFNEITLDEL